MAMSSISRKEYLREVQKQYLRANKHEKQNLLNVAVVFTGLNRKYLGILLSSRRVVKVDKPSVETRGRKVRYEAAFHDALLVCWHAENDICAERLQPFLPELVPKLEACGVLGITTATRKLLLAASIATVNRTAWHYQTRYAAEKPGSSEKREMAGN
jgi:hypothetical protein